jgi:flavodoxin
MRVLVVYKSITGFTKKYAEWISKELNADCVPLDSEVQATHQEDRA